MVKAITASKTESFSPEQKEQWLKANNHFFNRYPAGVPRSKERNCKALKEMILAGAKSAEIIHILENQFKDPFYKIVDWVSVQPEWVTLQARRTKPAHEPPLVKVEVINATIRNCGKYKSDCEHCLGHGLRYK